jgi:hypothetical protein
LWSRLWDRDKFIKKNKKNYEVSLPTKVILNGEIKKKTKLIRPIYSLTKK